MERGECGGRGVVFSVCSVSFSWTAGLAHEVPADSLVRGPLQSGPLRGEFAPVAAGAGWGLQGSRGPLLSSGSQPFGPHGLNFRPVAVKHHNVDQVLVRFNSLPEFLDFFRFGRTILVAKK